MLGVRIRTEITLVEVGVAEDGAAADECGAMEKVQPQSDKPATGRI